MADQQIGRLAMRHEGNFWNAYYAEAATMKGAVLLGSISMAFIVGHPRRKETFMALMRDAVADILEEKLGQRPTWPDGPRPAPEAERSGNA